MKIKQIADWNIENPKSKTEKVLSHLVNVGSIDTWEAITKYKATRLSSIIFNLKYHVNIKSVPQRDEEDGRCNWVKYVYKGRKKAVFV